LPGRALTVSSNALHGRLPVRWVGSRSMRIRSKTYGRDLLKPLQESLNFCFGKCLAIGIKLSQQPWKYLGEAGKNLLEFRKRASERLNSDQVFAESLLSLDLVRPDASPILACLARGIAPTAIVREKRRPTESSKQKNS